MVTEKIYETSSAGILVLASSGYWEILTSLLHIGNLFIHKSTLGRTASCTGWWEKHWYHL